MKGASKKKKKIKTDNRIVNCNENEIKIVYYHIAHLPRGPMKPVAWHSSMKTIAPYCSARSQISRKGVTSPSIENTPSVTINRIRDDCRADNAKATVFIKALINNVTLGI